MADEHYTSTFDDSALSPLDAKVTRAFRAALDAFNGSNWDATVIACAKVLEEVAKTELPYNERGGSLSQLLERLSKHIRLEQPVLDLAGAIKDVRGLGGYFDLERANDAELARATLSLVEAFITYTYMFKAKVDALVDLVEARQHEQPQAVDTGSTGARPVLDGQAGETPADRSQSSPASAFDAFEEDHLGSSGSGWRRRDES